MFGDARDWFFEKHLGLFVHFGPYAMAGWHEQDQMRRRIPAEEYIAQARTFNPHAFDAEGFVALALDAGYEYLCFTSKHHDGFCLWDSDLTDYKITNTPYGKDLIGQLAEACHRQGMPLGIYYSVVDWYHPDYPNQGRHHEIPEARGEGRLPVYIDYLRAQCKELCTRYGKIVHWFWDMNVPEHRDESINNELRALQPGMVINDRGFDEGDFSTPERDYNQDVTTGLQPFASPTEACNSVGSQSWGFRENEDYFLPGYLIEQMDPILARGGNYLLNTSLDGEGRLPEKCESILNTVGDWYRRTREAFHPAAPCSFLRLEGNPLLTHRGQTLYVHLPRARATESAILAPLATLPRCTTLLNTGEAIETRLELLPIHWSGGQPCLRAIGLPDRLVPDETLILKLEFDRPLTEISSDRFPEFQG
ncbi:MAG: alpha-L-fucosidase [Planctomycetota bacterium]|jgi:alpha-L-fucosidase